MMCTRTGALVMVPAGRCVCFGVGRAPLAVVRRSGVSCSSGRGLTEVGRYPSAWCMTVVSWHEGVGYRMSPSPSVGGPAWRFDRPPEPVRRSRRFEEAAGGRWNGLVRGVGKFWRPVYVGPAHAHVRIRRFE